MRIGVSLRSSYDVDARTGARWMTERAEAAAAAGLEWLFVGDHHSTGPGTYYQNVPILGRMLAAWPDRPAGALFLLPLWHPVLLAEQVGTLASLARGPFVIQTAIGGGRAQFDGLGVPFEGSSRALRGRARRVAPAARAASDVSDPDGRSGYVFHDARIAPVPTEPVDVWIGASAPAAIDRAARLGDGWLANADIVPDDAREQAAIHAERAAAHGRPPQVVAIRRDVHVGRDARPPPPRWPSPCSRAATAASVPKHSCGATSSRWRSSSGRSRRWATPRSSSGSSLPSRRTRSRSIELLAEVAALVADA